MIILQFLDISHAEIFTFHFMQTSMAYPLIGVSYVVSLSCTSIVSLISPLLIL